MLHTAIILAGGFGTRLKGLIDDLPKPLAPVNQRPFLDYLLAYLSAQGLQKLVLSTGYQAEKISKQYGPSYLGMDLHYIPETQPLGTGGGIRLACASIEEEECFVLNGDSFFGIALEDFYALHKKHGAQCSLALRQVENASRYGSIQMDKDYRITAFMEKSPEQQAGLINAGVYILNKNLFMQHSPENRAFSVERDFFEKQCLNLQIKGFPFSAYFIDIGVPEDYAKAQDDFKQFKYR